MIGINGYIYIGIEGAGGGFGRGGGERERERFSVIARMYTICMFATFVVIRSEKPPTQTDRGGKWEQQQKEITYHFNHFHFGFDTQMIQKRFQIFFHLDRVVFDLGDGEYAELAIFPGAVLLQ